MVIKMKCPICENEEFYFIPNPPSSGNKNVYTVVFAELEDGLGIHSECTFSIAGFKRYFRELSEDDLGPEEIK